MTYIEHREIFIWELRELFDECVARRHFQTAALVFQSLESLEQDLEIVFEERKVQELAFFLRDNTTTETRRQGV